MFKIENHIIGGAKVFIIAELGINHQGNLKKCKKLIDAAKKSGADAVKLQNVILILVITGILYHIKFLKKIF